MLNDSRGGKPPVKPNTRCSCRSRHILVGAAAAVTAVHLFADAVAADAADAVAHVVHPVGREGPAAVEAAVVVAHAVVSVAVGQGAADHDAAAAALLVVESAVPLGALGEALLGALCKVRRRRV